MRIVGAVGTFFAALIALIFALAIADTVTGTRVTLFGSRNALGIAGLLTAAAVAVLRFRRAGATAAARPATGSRVEMPPPSAPTSAPRMTAAPAAVQPSRAVAPDPDARAIEAASRQAIVFRQVFPPSHRGDESSFFGGTPFAGRQLRWPRDPHGKPMHFVLQIDCAEVPSNARLGLLPDDGILCFFLDLEWAATAGFQVVYDRTPRDQRGSIEQPRELGPLFGQNALYLWSWPRTEDESPRSLPRWPFEPVAIEIERDPQDDEDDENAPLLWGGRNIGDALKRAQGAEVPSTRFTGKDFAVADGALRRPFPGFPHDWRAVQICSGIFAREAARAGKYPRQSLFAELSDDERTSRLEGIEREAGEWMDFAASQPPFDAVSPELADRYWDWVADHAPLMRHYLPDGLTLSIEASLAASEAAASRVPAEVARRIHSRHALVVTHEGRAHVNTPDRMLAAPVDVQGNQWERAQTHLLLLELSSNEGIGHHFAEGVYQFWIKPGDLRERRFDRVELTSDAY